MAGVGPAPGVEDADEEVLEELQLEDLAPVPTDPEEQRYWYAQVVERFERAGILQADVGYRRDLETVDFEALELRQLPQPTDDPDERLLWIVKFATIARRVAGLTGDVPRTDVPRGEDGDRDPNNHEAITDAVRQSVDAAETDTTLARLLFEVLDGSNGGDADRVGRGHAPRYRRGPVNQLQKGIGSAICNCKSGFRESVATVYRADAGRLADVALPIAEAARFLHTAQTDLEKNDLLGALINLYRAKERHVDILVLLDEIEESTVGSATQRDDGDAPNTEGGSDGNDGDGNRRDHERGYDDGHDDDDRPQHEHTNSEQREDEAITTPDWRPDTVGMPPLVSDGGREPPRDDMFAGPFDWVLRDGYADGQAVGWGSNGRRVPEFVRRLHAKSTAEDGWSEQAASFLDDGGENGTVTIETLRGWYRDWAETVVRSLEMLLVVRNILRLVTVVAGLLIFLVAVMIHQIGPDLIFGDVDSTALLHPGFTILVFALGVLGSAVNTARTWPRMVFEFKPPQPRLSLTRWLVVARLLLGGVGALLIFVVLTSSLVGPSVTPPLVVLASFAAGFSDQLFVAGIERFVKTQVKKGELSPEVLRKAEH